MERPGATRRACSQQPSRSQARLDHDEHERPELSVSTAGNAPPEIRLRWQCDDDRQDAEAAEAERLREQGKTVVSIVE
jgi:hypothetical protein